MIEMNNLGDQLNFEVRHGKVINADYTSEICDVEVDGKVYMGVPIDMKLLPEDSPIHETLHHRGCVLSQRVHIQNNIDKAVLVAFGTPLNEYPKVIGFKESVPVFYMSVFNTSANTVFTAKKLMSLTDADEHIKDSLLYDQMFYVSDVFGDDVSDERIDPEIIDEFKIKLGDENDGFLQNIMDFLPNAMGKNIYFRSPLLSLPLENDDDYGSKYCDMYNTLLSEMDAAADAFYYDFRISRNSTDNIPGGDYIYKNEIIPVNNNDNKDAVLSAINMMDQWQKRSVVRALAEFIWGFFKYDTDANNDLYRIEQTCVNYTQATYNYPLFHPDYDYQAALDTLLYYFEPENMYQILTQTACLRQYPSAFGSTYAYYGSNAFTREISGDFIKYATHDVYGSTYIGYVATPYRAQFSWHLDYDYDQEKYVFTNKWTSFASTQHFGNFCNRRRYDTGSYSVEDYSIVEYPQFGDWDSSFVISNDKLWHSGYGELPINSQVLSFLKFGNIKIFASSKISQSSQYGPPDGSDIIMLNPNGTVAEDVHIRDTMYPALLLYAPVKSLY